MTSNAPRTGYAPLNGVNMYYEIHGSGLPIVVLHGAFMTIELMGKLIAELARTRQVITVEMQAHGHTPDIDRPLTYEDLADDTAALMRHLGTDRADVYGYSLGGGVALQLAMRHPEMVRKLVAVSASYTSAGLYPEVTATIDQITPDLFNGTPRRAAYDRAAPNPEGFGTLVARVLDLDMRPYDWTVKAMRAIRAPNADRRRQLRRHDPRACRRHVRLRGGGVFGDIAGMPAAQLAVLPGTSHVGMIDRVDWLAPMVVAFLDAPEPGAPASAG
jgi:pimeloyl-ACP methyl ester carboxylesterase